MLYNENNPIVPKFGWVYICRNIRLKYRLRMYM